MKDKLMTPLQVGHYSRLFLSCILYRETRALCLTPSGVTSLVSKTLSVSATILKLFKWPYLFQAGEPFQAFVHTAHVDIRNTASTQQPFPLQIKTHTVSTSPGFSPNNNRRRVEKLTTYSEGTDSGFPRRTTLQ